MLCCLCLQDLSIILLLISVRQIHEVIAVKKNRFDRFPLLWS